jgi:hypothetical protein
MTMSVGNFRATRSAPMKTEHAICVFPRAIPPPWIVRAVSAVAMLVMPITYAAVPTCGYYSCFQAKAAEAKVMNSQMEALKKERVAQAEARCAVLLRVSFALVLSACVTKCAVVLLLS